MKKVFALLSGVFLLFGIVYGANAALIDRGNGLIYDSNQNITWLQDANYAKTSGYGIDGMMYWNDSRWPSLSAVPWVDQLEYGDHDDWRLPALSELQSLYSSSNIRTSNPGPFINLGNQDYWSRENPPYSFYFDDGTSYAHGVQDSYVARV
ncbi:exported hypothetical protein [uncultured Desulfobacterium sp.]|uniref:Lcl C-terminal domain-containing protein n=1 Tax=uncultured Desulfobacterium sp. TaxID=201089 RepID=A0A445N0Q6_9BACT|nr:exported hypothetical protein [uncultured Desulfobacterium sp.]